MLREIDPNLCDMTFAASLKDKVNVKHRESRKLSSTVTSKRRQGVDATTLARRFGIGIDAAKRTLDRTTQRGVRTVTHSNLSRRYRTNDRQLRYKRLGCDMFTDTLQSSVTSKRMNKHAQVFGTNFGWARVFPMQKKGDAHHALSLLFKRDGVPDTLFMDNSKEQTLGDFRRKAREADSHVKQLEAYSPWANAAEGTIKEVKKGAGRKMLRSKAPKRLWDDCLELEALIRSHTALDIFELDGEVPETMIKGETADISKIVEFGWYEWVYFYDSEVKYPEDKWKLGRYLGPSRDIGPALTAKVLKHNGDVRHLTTLRPLSEEEREDVKVKEAMTAFDNNIEIKLGGSAKAEDIADDIEIETPTWNEYQDDNDGGYAMPLAERDELDEDTYDNYIGASVQLAIGDKVMLGQVKGRKRDRDGHVRGKANNNPILDTRVYNVEFLDGTEAEYAANTIAENMWAQCDENGMQHLLMDEIVGHKCDSNVAVPKSEGHIMLNGRKSLKKTTVGWSVCVKWKDGTASWEPVRLIKETYPVQLAEHAVSAEIDEEPAFKWWVPFTLKKRDNIISAVNTRYQRRTHKYGVELPKTVAEAKRLDRSNGNTLWQDAIQKEMNAVRVAFKLLNVGDKPPPTHQQIRCHMVFDIKMDSFARKARYVAQGNMTEAPTTLTHASVVSRDSARIALMLAALNDLEVKTADIANAYLQAPVTEKIWCITGPEFGADEGRPAIIVRALYGLRSAGAAFRNHLADCMRMLDYKPCLDDPDVWMKAETRPADNFRYYSYVLLYVDDALAIHHDAEQTLRRIDKYFPMKPKSIGDPDIYLGAKMRQVTLPNGVIAWAMSPSKHVQEAVRNVEEYLRREHGRELDKRASAPFVKDYRPELDVSEVLGPDEASHYQSLIGVLRWIVELGRVDIITEVSLLSSQMAMPRRGHLEAAFHMFAHLKIKHNSTLVFDPCYPDIDMKDFKDCDWKNFYGEVNEPMPPNAPPPLGKEVEIMMHVDADFAGDRVTSETFSNRVLDVCEQRFDYVEFKETGHS